MSEAVVEHRPPRFQHPNPTIELLVLAAPMIAMMVSRFAMSFVDFMMVSWMGTEATAAIGPASTFGFVLACIGMGIASAVQTFVSQSDGRGEPEQAGPYAWQSLYVSLVMVAISIPAALTTELWLMPVANFGRHSPLVATLEIEYLRYAILLVGPATLCAGLQGFFNGVQQPRVALYAVLISTCVNVLGNCALMFGMWGFPEMGIAGAGLATTIGWTVRALVLAAAMWMREFDQRFNTRRSLGLCWKKLGGLFYVGAPASVQWMIEIGAWMVFTVLIMPRFGTAALAAANVATQYMHMSFMPALGVGFAVTSQVGFAIGERRFEKAAERVRVGMRLTGTYMTLIGLILLIYRRPLVAWFNADETVVAMGAAIMIWVAIFQIFDAMTLTHMSALRGAGDTRAPAVIMAVASWTFQAGGAALVATLFPSLGIHGPWMMCTVYIMFLGVVLVMRWRAGHWREIKLFDEKKTGAVATEFDHEGIGAHLESEMAPEGAAPSQPVIAREP